MRQSFDIFNTFGADPASVENKIMGFNLTLEGIHTDFIAMAFKEWMAESKVFPTPAEILEKAVIIVNREANKKIRAEGGTVRASTPARPQRESKPYDVTKFPDWDEDTIRAFVSDFQNVERCFLEPLLKIKLWDWEGFTAALDSFRNAQAE